jgi:hypothetical protein
MVDFKLHSNRDGAIVRLREVDKLVGSPRYRGRLEIKFSGKIDRQPEQQQQTCHPRRVQEPPQKFEYAN